MSDPLVERRERHLRHNHATCRVAEDILNEKHSPTRPYRYTWEVHPCGYVTVSVGNVHDEYLFERRRHLGLTLRLRLVDFDRQDWVFNAFASAGHVAGLVRTSPRTVQQTTSLAANTLDLIDLHADHVLASADKTFLQAMHDLCREIVAGCCARHLANAHEAHLTDDYLRGVVACEPMSPRPPSIGACDRCRLFCDTLLQMPLVERAAIVQTGFEWPQRYEGAWTERSSLDESAFSQIRRLFFNHQQNTPDRIARLIALAGPQIQQPNYRHK